MPQQYREQLCRHTYLLSHLREEKLDSLGHRHQQLTQLQISVNLKTIVSTSTSVDIRREAEPLWQGVIITHHQSKLKSHPHHTSDVLLEARSPLKHSARMHCHPPRMQKAKCHQKKFFLCLPNVLNAARRTARSQAILCFIT